MKALVLLALAWSCSGQIIPHPFAIKYQGLDPFGQLTFGLQAFDQTRHETRLADGRVIGQFSYIDTNGEPAVTHYEAGPNGYRVLGSNILPEAPTADLTPPVDDLVAPEPVGYTAEVARARAEFLKIYEEAAAASSSAAEEVDVESSDPAPAVATYTAEAKPAEDEPAAAEIPPAGGESDDDDDEDSISRKKRQVKLPLPYLHAVPAEAEAKFETKQFETAAANTPADTTKIELTTKEHVFKVPAIKYVQPFINVEPVQYKAGSPPAVFPYHPFTFLGHQYPTFLAPIPKED